MATPSDPEYSARVRSLFEELVDLEPGARMERLRQVRREGAELADELSRLFAADASAGAVLENYEQIMVGARQVALDSDVVRPDLVGRTVEQYIVLEWLGSGGMGDVFKAWDTRLDRVAALKFLPVRLGVHTDARERFVHEAKSASMLDHPNICTIYEIGEAAEGQLFIAMPCYGGETLKEKISRGPLPIAQAINYATQMAEGLQRAHEAGIIHRDVKPANVMVTEHDHVKLLDFGIAKIAELDLTHTGMRLGTPAYMSPEHARGEPVDARADLWSLGVVLFEMLTGERPFKGSHDASLLLAIQTADPADVRSLRPEVPETLDEIIRKLLEKQPDLRHEGANALLHDLRAVAAGSTSPPSSGPLRERVAASQPAGRWFYGSLVAIAVVAVLWLATRAVAERDTVIDSIAVLPLASFSSDPDQDYLADGLTEELISVLGRVERLRVISRTSVMRFRDTNRPLPEISRELDVAAVVEGSVTATDGRVRVALRLVDGRTERLRWEQVFERDAQDVQTLQREVALALAREIELDLAVRDRVRDATTDPEAFRLYLRGVRHRNTDTVEGLLRAASYFEQAVARDSMFASAHACLSAVNTIFGGFHTIFPRTDAETRARRAAERALVIAPDLTEAYLAQGLIREVFDWDWKGAEESFRRAILLNPGNVDARYELGSLLTRMGRRREALIELNHALDRDPLSPFIHYAVGWNYLSGGRLDDAIAAGRHVLYLEPGYALAHIIIGNAHLAKGRHDEAIAAFERLVVDNPEDVHALGYLGFAYAVSGRRAEALRIVEDLEGRWGDGELAAYDIAEVYAGLGDLDEALDWLDIAYESRDASLLFLKVDPLYHPLRGEPRFRELLERMGLDAR